MEGQKLVLGQFYFIEDGWLKSCQSVGKHILQNTTAGRPYMFAYIDKETDTKYFVPISHQVNKYRTVEARKMERYGQSDVIQFCTVLGEERAILPQNVLPVPDKYIKGEYLSHGKPVSLPIDESKRVRRVTRRCLFKMKNDTRYREILSPCREMLEKMSKEREQTCSQSQTIGKVSINKRSMADWKRKADAFNRGVKNPPPHQQREREV